MKYSKDLKYFLDKYCTIFTNATSWHFKVENMMDYFAGIIHTIDENHIWIEHPKTNDKICISLEAVISISEEQRLYEDNPEHKELIEEYRKNNPAKAENTQIPPKQDRKKIDIEGLIELAS